MLSVSVAATVNKSSILVGTVYAGNLTTTSATSSMKSTKRFVCNTSAAGRTDPLALESVKHSSGYGHLCRRINGTGSWLEVMRQCNSLWDPRTPAPPWMLTGTLRPSPLTSQGASQTQKALAGMLVGHTPPPPSPPPFCLQHMHGVLAFHMHIPHQTHVI